MSDSFYNRGTKAFASGKLTKALAFYKREQFESKELYLNMGNVYRALGDFKEAERCYLLATRDSTQTYEGSRGLYAPALCNLGLLAYGAGNDLEACDFYKAALQLNPLTYDAIWNYSTALLRGWCSGSELHPDAWKMYAYRFKAVKAIDSSRLPWQGEAVDSLVILAEQGFGDKIMFGRYFSLAKARCQRLVLQLPKALWDLFPEYECCLEIPEGINHSIPLAGLTEVFGLAPAEYLAGYKKFLYSDPLRLLRVGVEWSGSATHSNDAYRSCLPQYFSDLQIPGVEFYNFRPDSKPCRGVTKVTTGTFGETAAALGAMDLVISVDTSLVHLAGSIGIETWMLQPTRESDFRWGLASTKSANGIDPESNIWYPSVRVLANPGWDKLFAEVRVRLENRLEQFYLERSINFIKAVNAQSS
jgi:tetratricopeptide (TPR) repeat protein